VRIQRGEEEENEGAPGLKVPNRASGDVEMALMEEVAAAEAGQNQGSVPMQSWAPCKRALGDMLRSTATQAGPF